LLAEVWCGEGWVQAALQAEDEFGVLGQNHVESDELTFTTFTELSLARIHEEEKERGISHHTSVAELMADVVPHVVEQSPPFWLVSSVTLRAQRPNRGFV
jgi:hypothetical protein